MNWFFLTELTRILPQSLWRKCDINPFWVPEEPKIKPNICVIMLLKLCHSLPPCHYLTWGWYSCWWRPADSGGRTCACGCSDPCDAPSQIPPELLETCEGTEARRSWHMLKIKRQVPNLQECTPVEEVLHLIQSHLYSPISEGFSNHQSHAGILLQHLLQPHQNTWHHTTRGYWWTVLKVDIYCVYVWHVYLCDDSGQAGLVEAFMVRIGLLVSLPVLQLHL